MSAKWSSCQGSWRACGSSRPWLRCARSLRLPMIIARSDLVATVPHAIGMYYSKHSANIKTMSPPPLDLPRIVLKQHWHRRSHHDPRNKWLRTLVSQLFSQESDEWKAKARD